MSDYDLDDEIYNDAIYDIRDVILKDISMSNMYTNWLISLFNDYNNRLFYERRECDVPYTFDVICGYFMDANYQDYLNINLEKDDVYELFKDYIHESGLFDKHQKGELQ